MGLLEGRAPTTPWVGDCIPYTQATHGRRCIPPAVIMSLDVAAAFDCPRPKHVADDLRARGATLGQVAAVLSDILWARG